MVDRWIMANWSFLTARVLLCIARHPGCAASRPAWASPSAAPTASSPVSPGPVRDQAERWPPQPLPDPGAPAAAGGCQPGTCHRRSPGRPPATLIGAGSHTPAPLLNLSNLRPHGRCCAADALQRRRLGVGGCRSSVPQRNAGEGSDRNPRHEPIQELDHGRQQPSGQAPDSARSLAGRSSRSPLAPAAPVIERRQNLGTICHVPASKRLQLYSSQATDTTSSRTRSRAA